MWNFGFRYPSSNFAPYTTESLAAGPWSSMAIGPSSDFFQDPDQRFDAQSVLDAPGSHVDALFGYLSFGRMQRGVDAFADIPDAHKFLTADVAADTVDLTDIFDLEFWQDSVRTVLQAEMAIQADQGMTGIFLDDFDRYLVNMDRLDAAIPDAFNTDPLRNAALAAMDAVVQLANAAPDLDIIVNSNAYLFSSHARFGTAGTYDGSVEDDIDRFADAVDAVVIENYWTTLQAGDPSFPVAIGALADEGLRIIASDDFFASTPREDILAFFNDAAKRGYLPTAAVIDDDATFDPGIEPTALYDRFPTGTFPVFNQVTELADVLVAPDTGGAIVAAGGRDTIYGGDSSDALTGGGQRDRLFGGASGDELRGGGGKDVLKGEAGRDLLLGGRSHDKLVGGSGRDTLRGGQGDDTLKGGGGVDSFFWRGEGSDTVLDFVEGTDIFDFSIPGKIITAEHWSTYASQVGDDVVVAYQGETLTFLSADLSLMLGFG